MLLYLLNLSYIGWTFWYKATRFLARLRQSVYKAMEAIVGDETLTGLQHKVGTALKKKKWKVYGTLTYSILALPNVVAFSAC